MTGMAADASRDPTRDLARDLAHLQEATNRLVRTVDGFEDGDWSTPSGLPGWTRAHVVAHLALNGEGLAGALTGIVQDEPTPMYASQEARDDDIEELAQAEPAQLRARLMGAAGEFADAAGAVPDDSWGARIERTPGGRTFAAAAAVGMRWREVEIHHVDLDAGYARSAWPLELCANVLDAMTKRGGTEASFVVRPLDLDAEWTFGTGGDPVVTGTAADLAWWLTGRGDGEGVSSSSGELPKVGSW
jgi:maleylpyruvate isomerase